MVLISWPLSIAAQEGRKCDSEVAGCARLSGISSVSNKQPLEYDVNGLP